jgi:two-component system sensor histidine kinase RegB
MPAQQIALDGSRLRLITTTRLRWFAVAGQMATIVGLYYGFRFPVPLVECVTVILLSALLNIALTAMYPASQRLIARHAMSLLGYDIVQLSALLYLTGGLENPFALLMVVPVAVSASTQPPLVTAALASLALASATVLALFHLPLPWANGLPPFLPETYILGVWTALVSCIIFIAIYAWRIGEEARQMSMALTAAELVLAREQKLTALDGLAAAAAHQLGTPLSTIALVAKELEREIPPESPYRDDILLLRAQATRCREILKELSASGREGQAADHIFSQMKLSHILEEVVAPMRSPEIEIEVRLQTPANGQKMPPEPVVLRNPGLIHGIGNLVENAVDFAEHRVEIEAAWTDETVSLTISDDGPGFHPTIINHLGEPYVTKRYRDGEKGMGLGFFIAKTLLDRSGATIEASNRPAPQTGAVLRIGWPRRRLETFIEGVSQQNLLEPASVY